MIDKKKTMLIFGAFNPVTIAHLNMGYLSKSFFPDRNVIYVPSNQRYLQSWKGYSGNDVLSEDMRVQLLRSSLQLSGLESSICMYEIEGISDGTTYSTLKMFRDTDNMICIGADKLEEIPRWFRWEYVVSNNQFFVVTRQGYDTTLPEPLQKYGYHFIYAEGMNTPVSSTQIRECCKSDRLEEIKHLIPECVYHFYKERRSR